MTLQELRSGRGTRGLDEWRYLQLCHFVSKLPNPRRTGDKLTDFEKLCDMEDPGNIVSRICKILMRMNQLETPPYIKKWEIELGTKIDETTIRRVLKMVGNSAIDARTAEISYKCISRSYLTPEITSKFQKDSAYCWRGCQEIGTMAHLWWLCPKIRIFWRKILALVKKITGKEVPEDPWVVLFHGGGGNINKYKRSLVPHLLNAAKRIIPKSWRKRESPETWEWIDAVEKTYNMVIKASSVIDTGSVNLAEWERWKKFKKTWCYAKELKALN